jgi:hypothetical protein
MFMVKLAKTPCFSYYLLCFFFYKTGEQEGRTGSAQAGLGRRGRAGLVPAGGGGERGRRMNIVQIMYTHVCKCKNDKC